MAKLVIGNEMYHAVSSTAFFEVEYENLVLSRASLLFPEHYAVPFKKRVESETGRAMADLALIDKGFQKWWVVEIELAHHSLSSHVLPQVAILANAHYGPDVAAYLANKARQLDPASLQSMMKGTQPEVLVIVNESIPAWQQPLSSYGALLSVVQVFRSDKNEHVLRLNGAYPSAMPGIVSTLRFDANFPRLMIVDSPGGLDPATRLSVDFEGFITEWARIDASDRVWLSPLKTNPLRTGRNYALVKRDDGRLGIELLR